MKTQNLAFFNKINRHWLLIAIKAGFAYALLVNSALALPRYTITDIGFGGSDINNQGQVAGKGVTAQGETHAFRYTDGVGYEDLGILDKFSSGTYAINDVGQVVGVSGNYGFRYTDGVGMENLSQLYCNLSNSSLGRSCSGRAVDINRTGQVIGDDFGLDTGERILAVRFTDGLTKLLYYDVAAVGDSVSLGLGINDAGQSVGYSVDSVPGRGIKHAFRITDGFGMEYLGSLGGSIQSDGETSWGLNTSSASGINNTGQVTGKSSTTSLTWHGFLYTDGVGMQDLGVLQGDDSSEGFELNDFGQIVGQSWKSNGGLSHPVLWNQPGCPEDLNLAPGVKESGWVLSSVASINNKGQIVGSGINPAGQSHGYRLTPVAASGAPQCSVPAVTPTLESTATIDPTSWKTVQPLQPCTTKVCKTKWAKNLTLLKTKALASIRTQRVAEKSPANTRKQVVANKARNQYNRVVSIIQGLHN